MNYRKLYKSLIENAKGRQVEGYTERHHILPKSMGGSDDPDNLVDLTAREHFIAHKLLSKMYGGKMSFAFSMMCLTRNSPSKHNKVDYKISSRDYNNAKVLISQLRKGKPMCPLVREKISKSTKGTKKSLDTRKKMSKPKSESHRLSISKSKTGKNNPMYGVKSPTAGIPHTKDVRLAISQKTKNACDYPPCPHCGKKTNKGNALRWHYDNCKEKGK